MSSSCTSMCAAFLRVRIQATEGRLADASVTNNPYDGTWGFWSGTSSSILVRCTGASGSAEKVPYATEVASPDDSS